MAIQSARAHAAAIYKAYNNDEDATPLVEARDDAIRAEERAKLKGYRLEKMSNAEQENIRQYRARASSSATQPESAKIAPIDDDRWSQF